MAIRGANGKASRGPSGGHRGDDHLCDVGAEEPLDKTSGGGAELACELRVGAHRDSQLDVARRIATEGGRVLKHLRSERGHQWSSVVIRGHQRPSVVIRGHQWSCAQREAISGRFERAYTGEQQGGHQRSSRSTSRATAPSVVISGHQGGHQGAPRGRRRPMPTGPQAGPDSPSRPN